MINNYIKELVIKETERLIIEKILEIPLDQWESKPDKSTECWFTTYKNIPIFLFQGYNNMQPFVQLTELETIASKELWKITNELWRCGQQNTITKREQILNEIYNKFYETST